LTIIRSIYQKEPADFDPDKPFSYRNIWIGLIASGVIYMLLLYSQAPSIPLHQMIGWMVVTILVVLGGTRVAVETGGYWGRVTERAERDVVTYSGYWSLVGTGAIPQPTPTADQWLFTWTSVGGFSTNQMPRIANNLAGIQLQSARETNTTTKSMVTFLLVGAAIAIIYSGFQFWYFMGNRHITQEMVNIGWDPSGWFSGWARDEFRNQYRLTAGAELGGAFNIKIFQNSGNALAMLFGSLIFAIAIPLIQVWIPSLHFINIAGIAFGVWNIHVLFPWIIALIAKLIVIRVYGNVVYVNKVKPLAMGLFAGVVFAYLIGMGIPCMVLMWYGMRMW
jgi:hypothetical protein